VVDAEARILRGASPSIEPLIELELLVFQVAELRVGCCARRLLVVLNLGNSVNLEGALGSSLGYSSVVWPEECWNEMAVTIGKVICVGVPIE
jgi:hypothetical protein